MKTKVFLGCLIGISLFCCSLSYPNLQEGDGTRVYQTSRIVDQTVEIDGYITEEAWDKVEWSGDFTQREPHDGAEPSQETAFKILYDDDNLYLAIRAYDSDPEKIVQRMSRRDGFAGDWVEVNINSYFDKRTAFSFTASVSGVKGDEAITNDGNNWDSTWDPIWELKTSIDKKGWVAEIRIPFTQLRFNNREEQIWGLQFTRRLFRKEERSNWQYIPQEEAGWVHHFGELRGIKGIKPKKQVEISPYIASSVKNYKEEVANPFSDGRDYGYDIGVDGKIGLTNDLTLDFTINPDFGQVEADPSEVNLTAFESYFEEKRPFFIEGRNITNFQLSSGGNPFSMDNLFYSRRIGRSPHHYPDVDTENNEFADVPERTKILGAAKVTGKTQKGWSVGVLESITRKETARVYQDGLHQEEMVEPWTHYFLGRTQKDLNGGNTIIGGMFTSTNRFSLNKDLKNLPANAYTGGVDFTQYWKDKKYYLRLKYTMSQIVGGQDAIQYQQESSRRYFQRPDNDYTVYDTTKSSLTGHGGTIEFGRQSSSKLRYLGWITWRSPGLELNDMGYLRQADAVFQVLWAGYRVTDPFSIFRQAEFNINQWTGWDFGWNSLFKGGNVNFWLQFTNHYQFGAGVNLDGSGISNTELRGGPSLKTPGGWNYWLNFGTDRRKKFFMYGWHSTSWGFEQSNRSVSFGVELNYRLVDALQFSFSPDYTIQKNELQYLNAEEVEGEDRYVFGRLNQVTTYFTVRVDYSLSPDLTVQYYGSPFISAVDYSNPKEISHPQATHFKDRFSYDVSFSEENYVEDYDFNFRQFRSNLVIRWEYQPGSLLYLVWTQGRTGSAETGGFSYNNDMKGLFDIYPENVFLVKLSYRFIK